MGLPPELAAIEDRLRHRLGTKVSVNPSRKGGTLVIHYYSDEELDALVERIAAGEG
jgi:ParB family chromosome partitioning protein